MLQSRLSGMTLVSSTHLCRPPLQFQPLELKLQPHISKPITTLRAFTDSLENLTNLFQSCISHLGRTKGLPPLLSRILLVFRRRRGVQLSPGHSKLVLTLPG
jgi:hypothetical protein